MDHPNPLGINQIVSMNFMKLYKIILKTKKPNSMDTVGL